ncbi:deoxyguanosinetriphosphate triphosphohydrolase [Glutamicibacter bergerei]|uniref:Deoxyguanosinetriphosphate triphosphohydrolase-like protein n=2 Tax=Glutamicibacter TaxID=1742989 RepID=A0ABV9MPS1_9MICC|nr:MULTISPECIES: deoxyguanosinetriphosphate triphosphohydrolase [Glutamicibacter]PCC33346.1 deoxyguanosinetriphosphate triphosphohydrolase [Glutamicibacter sp. BW77]GGJ55573.1 deoxyguanosinetriphosphate triphosphohydrolase-like protein [Glutamicibacter ardleyensis]HBV08839.1 deoxyguanosinetriphosphate triphosphohydrolase [Micrococcaceae bacterium]
MTQINGYTEADQERWVPEPAKKSYRTAFARDRARVLHSSALRRLGAKTQVVSPTLNDFVRTRLTHSLEVAQVGRELGAALGCDPDIVDTACLAHDLGHPPFGHNGEKALNKLAKDIGGFEGNAQTLRLLTRLETKTFRHNGHSAGLNLSRAALDASCKYPWLREEAPLRNGKQTKKFGVYTDDQPVFDWLRSGPDSVPGRVCMEGQVMDLADDISYSVHDVEDAIVGGRFQLRWLLESSVRDRALQVTKDWYLPTTDESDIDAALTRLEASAEWVSHADGSRRARAALKDMTSQFIGRFCQAAMDATRSEFGQGNLTRYNAQLIVPEETEHEIAVMKGIAANFVMTKEELQPMYLNQRQILTDLVDLLSDNEDKYLEPIFAADYKDAANEQGRLRVVIDQVASLTDASALEWHASLVKGESYEPKLF